MTTTPDFSKLYAQLNLRPDCSLEEFKHAYRRKVATLHPDRHSGEQGVAGDARVPLSDLMSLYGMAIQFQRDHGRLPGAPVTNKSPSLLRPPRNIAPMGAYIERQGEQAVGSISRRNWLLLAGLLALVAYLVISSTPDMPADQPPNPAHHTAVPAAGASAQPLDGDQIALGMDTATVLSVQGTPSRSSEELWEYGPSWIRFEKGLVVGWYSSPLYRLRTSKQQASGEHAPER